MHWSNWRKINVKQCHARLRTLKLMKQATFPNLSNEQPRVPHLHPQPFKCPWFFAARSAAVAATHLGPPGSIAGLWGRRICSAQHRPKHLPDSTCKLDNPPLSTTSAARGGNRSLAFSSTSPSGTNSFLIICLSTQVNEFRNPMWKAEYVDCTMPRPRTLCSKGDFRCKSALQVFTVADYAPSRVQKRKHDWVQDVPSRKSQSKNWNTPEFTKNVSKSALYNT